MQAFLDKPGIDWIFAGIGIGVVAIFTSGFAGRFKDRDLGSNQGFNLGKGLPLCVLAGVLSAVYGFALAAGQPIADLAAKHGAGHFQGNAIYIFANSGCFLTSLFYCSWLHLRNRNLGEYLQLPALGGGRLSRNLALSILTGCLWYGQFFFYGLGHVRMGTYQFSSSGIHMIMLVLFRGMAGLVLREWKGCANRTWSLLGTALLLLLLAVLALSYDSSLSETVANH